MYDRWLTTVANPFWTQLPDVVHCSSWRIIAANLGSVTYDHLVCVYTAESDDVATLISAKAVQEFLSYWQGSWGHRGDIDEERSMRALRATEVAPAGKDSLTDYLIFLPHTPRPGSHERGFEEWLRDVDSPVVNGFPEVSNYSGWRVDEMFVGQASFTNFDMMYVNRADGFDRLYGNPDVLQHSRRWIELWGQAPDGNQGENFPAFTAKRIA